MRRIISMGQWGQRQRQRQRIFNPHYPSESTDVREFMSVHKGKCDLCTSWARLCDPENFWEIWSPQHINNINTARFFCFLLSRIFFGPGCIFHLLTGVHGTAVLLTSHGQTLLPVFPPAQPVLAVLACGGPADLAVLKADRDSFQKPDPDSTCVSCSKYENPKGIVW